MNTIVIQASSLAVRAITLIWAVSLTLGKAWSGWVVGGKGCVLGKDMKRVMVRLYEDKS